MKSGICPKCKSASVHMADATKFSDHDIPITMWKRAYLVYYVCATCGFVETYVLTDKDRAKVADNLPRVEPGRAG